ncbi:MAG: response regulator transcription factor [Desulfobacteraceae bacterium]|nr:response regulator transcription factor [Desulfobacteraceae bacterium]
MNKYTLILADDHNLLRHGIRQILEKQGTLSVIGEAGDGLELLRLLTAKTPDMILLDIAMPNLRGIEAAIEIKMLYPGIKILILSMHKSLQYVHHALSAGADGYLLKEDAPRELVSAIETIQNNDIYISPLIQKELTNDLAQSYRTGEKLTSFEPLTVREREVLKLIAEEKSNQDIAELLNISIATVKHHRATIKKKLDIRKTAGLVKYAIRKGYTTAE